MAIERIFVQQNLKEFQIKQFITGQLSRVGLSDIKLQRTPLGDKILIKASRPGLVVGRAGSNIQKLTEVLKKEFSLENPQIEIEEIQTVGLDADIIAEMIVNSLERFGSQRFKGVGHKSMAEIMNAGALGVEILISGKIPSQRAKTWRFYQGYLKKCGDVAISGVNIAYKTAVLKTGAVGIKVSIMPPTTKLPDQIILQEPDAPTVEEVSDKKTKEEMESVVEDADKSETKTDKKTESNEKSKSKSTKKKSKKSSKTESKEKSRETPKDEKPAKEESKETSKEEKPQAQEAKPAVEDSKEASKDNSEDKSQSKEEAKPVEKKESESEPASEDNKEASKQEKSE